MSGPWAYNASSPSSVTYGDVREMFRLANSIQPYLPAPIIAVKATLDEFVAAMDQAGVEKREAGNPFFQPLGGLDVVPEGEYVYVGAPSDISKARKKWGSLTVAREAWERSKAVRGEGCK